MEPVHIFSGSALAEIGADGAVRLPRFVRQALGGRGARVIVGVHEQAPCLTGSAVEHSRALLAELERRRLRDEEAGVPPEAHHRRARRAFGMAEEADCDGRGRTRLPPLIRRRGGIAHLALFVGTGADFEIWDPALAEAAGDETLREIAAWRLAEWTETGKEEESER